MVNCDEREALLLRTALLLHELEARDLRIDLPGQRRPERIGLYTPDLTAVLDRRFVAFAVAQSRELHDTQPPARWHELAGLTHRFGGDFVVVTGKTGVAIAQRMLEAIKGTSARAYTWAV